ncbi:cobalt ion binding [Forsythia ovata]|uniref:Cobalt ion binding n=1 Tax=Forsythia ovata TaxID=205694 RepID=A0ABD1XDG4_9LAMI
MALHLSNCALPATEVCFPANCLPNQLLGTAELRFNTPFRTLKIRMSALDRNSIGSSDGGNSSKKAATPNLNYVVPLDKSSCITRPLAEILRDLNKRIPDNIIKNQDDHSTFIPWYQANRMLSFYAPGWCGEIRDVIFADNGSVTVVYRVTVRGLDGEAHRESTGTVSPGDGDITDPVAAAEEIAFCRACARFGLGLYLYHED